MKLDVDQTKESKKAEHDTKKIRSNWRDFSNYIGPESSDTEADTDDDE